MDLLGLPRVCGGEPIGTAAWADAIKVFPACAGVNRSRSLDAGDASIGVLVEQLLQDFAGAEETDAGPPVRHRPLGKSSCSPRTGNKDLDGALHKSTPDKVVAKLALADEALINGTQPSTCFSGARFKPLPLATSVIDDANFHAVVAWIAHVPCCQHVGQIFSQDVPESR